MERRSISKMLKLVRKAERTVEKRTSEITRSNHIEWEKMVLEELEKMTVKSL